MPLRWLALWPTWSSIGITGLVLSMVLMLHVDKTVETVYFDEPIDALSVGVNTDTIHLAVSAEVDGHWTAWQELEIEKEFDPTLRESNLVIFPEPVTAVRLRGLQTNYELHPLRVSQEPPSYLVAARTQVDKPRIMSRDQWRANETFLYKGGETTRSDVTMSEDYEKSPRATECKRLKRTHADEFRVERTVTRGKNNQTLRWPQKYSPDIKLLVIHHTAQKSRDDKREGWERMRLLYNYHANSRGWGDVGYNFVIDEKGQIYEGRAGGKYVVGGHAFCANVGTLGIALMGNFEEEEPSQDQMKALQWLLKSLSDDYGIDMKGKVQYHGKWHRPVVGHRDLVQTSCPGYFVAETLNQVRRNVQRNRVDQKIIFPKDGALFRTSAFDNSIPWYSNLKKANFTPVGTTDLSGRPGSQTTVSLTLRAGDTPINQRSRIADVVRSDPTIGIWQEMVGGRETRVRAELLAPKSLNKGEVTTLRLRFQFPNAAGIYTLRIGNVPYVLTAKGRAIGAAKGAAVRRKLQLFTSLLSDSATSRPRYSLVRRPPRILEKKPAAPVWTPPDTNDIRIRLSFPESYAAVHVQKDTFVNGNESDRHRIDISKEGNECVATEYGIELGRGTVQIVPGGDGVFTITNWETSSNRFRGKLECQIIDGEMALINELPLEEYMAGLAEEPDSEPYEKQRAFAIAARSYAAHYMSPDNRKFPGRPYDGNDSPASFQKYGGLLFEEKNPRWVQAVNTTSGLVIKKDNVVVKTPYFSADNGRTKSPKEAGWNRFPFAEVFASKPDPWCQGMLERGHGVGMSGCGARGQAEEGKSGEEILMYYYPGTEIAQF